MVTFWSRLCSFPPPRWSILVPRHARLQPPPPHSVHRSRIRCRLVPCNGPRCPPCWAGESEETSRPPGGIVDQAGATLYGLPPALAVQGLHIGFGHHHFGAGGTHTRLVLHVNRSAEESTSKKKRLLLSLVTLNILTQDIQGLTHTTAQPTVSCILQLVVDF